MMIPLKDRGRSENRTLEKLKTCNQMFVQAGSKLSDAKKYNNVIAEPLFNIPLNQVIIIQYALHKINISLLYFNLL